LRAPFITCPFRTFATRPGVDTPASEAAKAAFLSKLDFFGEGRRGVSCGALRVWWGDLEVAIAALDGALNGLEDALSAAGSDHDSGGGGDDHNDDHRHSEGGAGAARASSPVPAAVASLVSAIVRATAACAPLGHRMLDEALLALHRAQRSSHVAAPLLPFFAAGAGPRRRGGAADGSEGAVGWSMDSAASGGSFGGDSFGGGSGGGGSGSGGGVGPDRAALLGLGALGGLVAPEELLHAYHFSGRRHLDGGALPSLLSHVGLVPPSRPVHLQVVPNLKCLRQRGGAALARLQFYSDLGRPSNA